MDFFSQVRTFIFPPSLALACSLPELPHPRGPGSADRKQFYQFSWLQPLLEPNWPCPSASPSPPCKLCDQNETNSPLTFFFSLKISRSHPCCAMSKLKSKQRSPNSPDCINHSNDVLAFFRLCCCASKLTPPGSRE